jgi:hypothetical protein
MAYLRISVARKSQGRQPVELNGEKRVEVPLQQPFPVSRAVGRA